MEVSRAGRAAELVVAGSARKITGETLRTEEIIISLTKNDGPSVRLEHRENLNTSGSGRDIDSVLSSILEDILSSTLRPSIDLISSKLLS